MSLPLLLIAIQGVPVITVAPRIAPSSIPSPSAVVSQIEVDVRARDELIYNGVLRVGAGSPASFSRTLSEAAEKPCLTSGGRWQNNVRSSFTLNISPSYGEPDRLSINLSWQRPIAGDCEEGGGTRTVQLQQSIQAPVGGEVKIEGDAGLVVRFKRR